MIALQSLLTLKRTLKHLTSNQISSFKISMILLAMIEQHNERKVEMARPRSTDEG